VRGNPRAVLYKRLGNFAEELWLAPHRIHLEYDPVRYPMRFDHGDAAVPVERERHRDDRFQGIALGAAGRRNISLATETRLV
jgi:hypothetical protein